MDFVAAECSARLICFDFSVSREPTAEGGGGGGKGGGGGGVGRLQQ